LLLFLFGFIAPFALARSYAIGSSTIVFLVLVLLNIPIMDKPADLHISMLRLESTGLGCAMAVVGVLLLRARPLIAKLIKKPSVVRRK
jgi:hypothetical protein